MRWMSLLAVAALVVAGCSSPADTTDEPGDSSSSTTPTVSPPPAAFVLDGDGAYAYVEGLVRVDGESRYRVPGTESHAEAANWLESTMGMPGWTVSRQTFTGEDYMATDKGRVGGYDTNPAYCLERDRDQLPDIVFHNLVASWGDNDGPTWVLGAHWDSKEEASMETDPNRSALPIEGANDGGSGVGVLLQLMDHVSKGELTPLVNLEVVFFDGEDGFEDCHPLAGSVYYVENLNRAIDQMVLLDMVGDADARYPKEANSASSSNELYTILWGHGNDAGLGDNLLGPGDPVFDDHIPFLDAGIPALDIIDYGRERGAEPRAHTFPPYWHTLEDTMDNINADMLGMVGSMLANTLVDPAILE